MENKKNTVFTEIEINATPEEVWNVLTDWEKLNEWSTSFVGISVDELTKGKRFKVYFKNPLNGDVLEFERVCTVYEAGEKFGWSGELTSHGFTDNHIFTLEPTESGDLPFSNKKTVFMEDIVSWRIFLVKNT